MSGPKAYTMREMKGIVEYLVEHKAYSEIRGRKMWVDFANSSLTTRTWQSLKETFIKRILPDIQNPYYQLTRDQVCSFKQGTDVEAKEKKNRLEIQTVGEESSNAENQKDIEQPSTSAENRNEVEKTSGEENKSEQIRPRNRSSADTYIIEEENVSISSDDDPEISKKTTEQLLAEFEEPTTKSIRECSAFEYSEPPSVVTEVINDFETESEGSDKEPQMQIVEDVTEKNNSDANRDSSNQDIIIVEDSENLENVEYIEDARIVVEGGKEVEIGPTFDHEIITEVTSTDLQGINLNWLKDCAQKEHEIQRENNGLADKIIAETETNADAEINDDAEINADAVTNADAVINDEGEINAEAETSAKKQNGDVRKNGPNEETEPIVIDDSENLSETLKETDNNKSLDNNKNNENSLSTTADSLIPNNQEVLNAQITTSQITPNGTLNITAPKEAATRKRSTSQDETISKKKKLDNGIEETNDKAIEVTPASSNNTEALFEALKKADNPNDKSSTLQDAQGMDETPQNKNPCLKSVSLFEEQFNTTKYTDSEDDTPLPKNVEKENASIVDNKIMIVDDKNMEETVKDQPKSIQKQEVLVHIPQVEKNNKTEIPLAVPPKEIKDVIVLRSNSESDEVQQTPFENRKEKFKHLAQAFGFVPGTSMTAAHRRRSLRTRNRTKSQRNSCVLESSDWEGSISEPELADGYISPPRGRRNRNARRYKKPQSARIMSLDEEGGLFVVHGNKIIPLVKNGKTLTFVTYDALGCSEEEEESIWRQKYIDEKKKAALLKRQLEQATSSTEVGTSRPKSPIIPVTSSRNASSTRCDKTAQKPMEIDTNNKQMNIKEIGETGKIQITLTKKNEETINLEGHWPQVLPIVQQVMSLFYQPDNAVDKPKVIDQATIQKEDISGLATPIIPIVEIDARQIDDIESEIFKEIEERDKEEKSQTTTKRRAGRPKKTPSTEKAAKRPRRSKNVEQINKAETGDQPTMPDAKEVEENNIKTRSSSVVSVSDRSSVESVDKVKLAKEKVKLAKEKVESTKEKAESAKDKVESTTEKVKPTKDKESETESIKTIGQIEPRMTRSRKSGNETDSSTMTVTTRLSTKPKDADDEDIRYMLPPEPKTRKSSSKNTPVKSRSMNPHEISTDRSRNSVDSSQGYQDSDATPAKVNTIKKKRKVSITVRKGKPVRRKSIPSVQDMSLDSSNSSYFVPRKSKSQSTLNSAIYKTESYQILMGNRKLPFVKLDIIDETGKSDELKNFTDLSKESSDNSNIYVEVGSSSNVSLPLSPELSVVENLSISRDMIQSDNHPTLNEMQVDSMATSLYNKGLFANVDVSIPLMQQNLELLKPQSPVPAKKKSKSPIKVSEFIKRVSVNTSLNNTLSDSLDRKLHNLLLESAKKISDTNKDSFMDVDKSTVKPPKAEGKKEKKRCSTPRKRNSKKAKANVGPVIDEHVESCSHGGRKSCPPLITFLNDDNANNSSDVQLTANKPNPKARMKKDVIKVKILRPTSARLKKKATENAVETTKLSSNSRVSVNTDSGINETASLSGVFLQDSVDLIHNHSETCLQVNECINDTKKLEENHSETCLRVNECISDSIECMENSKCGSIISLDSTASLECKLMKVMEDVERLSGVSRNAIDISGELSPKEMYGSPTGTVYHSPVASNSSLITEDLSDEPEPPTRWYLLSEDDTNTNIMRPEQMTSNSRVSNFSANLKQLFPIACAVPDLSTISELSKENESRKDSDGDSRSYDFKSIP